MAPDYLISRLRKAAAQLPHLPGTLRLVWQAAPGWTLAWVLLLLVQGFLPAATVYLTRPLVNGIVSGIRAGGDWRPVLLPASLMAAVLLLSELLQAAIHWIRTAQADLVQDHIASMVHAKSAAADLAFYESPDFYDHLHRARAEAGYRPIALLETLGGILQNGVTLVAMLIVLAGFGAWLPLALFISTVPAFVVVLRYAARQHEFRFRATSLERRAWYYDWLLTSAEAAPEIRLFALGDHFQSAYRSVREKLRTERLDLARSQSLAEIAAGLSALAVAAAAFVWMAARTLRGALSLGDLALFYQAFQQGLRLARSLLENVGQLYQNSLFLGNLFEFLALQPRVVSPPNPALVPEPLRHGIRFDNVTFRYPGSSALALRDFNLTIPAGRLIAIVGPNGAGKSTLLKLLCRFYDPDEGSISIDGIDLRNLSIDDLRRRITVLFQQPLHYNATVRENIALDHAASDPVVRTAAETAGADAFVERLPLRYDNLLGHWFDKGTELSVGEWQRLALARAFLRDAPLILLDEPTSAMDPWAEAPWLDRFRALAAGRTAILITHRFTTARLADEIHVIEEGRIIESGAHDELIARPGRYAEWWSAQRIA